MRSFDATRASLCLADRALVRSRSRQLYLGVAFERPFAVYLIHKLFHLAQAGIHFSAQCTQIVRSLARVGANRF